MEKSKGNVSKDTFNQRSEQYLIRLASKKNINQAFLILAMSAGMDSAILDPTNKDIPGLFYATKILLQKDDFCLEFINEYIEELFGTKKQ